MTGHNRGRFTVTGSQRGGDGTGMRGVVSLQLLVKLVRLWRKAHQFRIP